MREERIPNIIYKKKSSLLLDLIIPPMNLLYLVHVFLCLNIKLIITNIIALL